MVPFGKRNSKFWYGRSENKYVKKYIVVIKKISGDVSRRSITENSKTISKPIKK